MPYRPTHLFKNYPCTPSQWMEFFSRSKFMVLPHFVTGQLRYMPIKEAKLLGHLNYEPNFHGNHVSAMITTATGKEIGVVYCNGLPDIEAVNVPLLQVDMHDAINNQRWIRPDD